MARNGYLNSTCKLGFSEAPPPLLAGSNRLLPRISAPPPWRLKISRVGKVRTVPLPRSEYLHGRFCTSGVHRNRNTLILSRPNGVGDIFVIDVIGNSSFILDSGHRRRLHGPISSLEQRSSQTVTPRRGDDMNVSGAHRADLSATSSFEYEHTSRHINCESL